MVSDAWVAEHLTALALRFWMYCDDFRDNGFLLDPRSLPDPIDEAGCEQFLMSLYSHARVWAPGLTTPFDSPVVRFADLKDKGGQYYADESGYLHVEVANSLRKDPCWIRPVLCHEACHHIHDGSSVASEFIEHGEELTDISMFLCGFGEVYMDGYATISKKMAGTVGLGYLTVGQFRLCQAWVAKARGIIPDADCCSSIPTPSSPPSKGNPIQRFFRRIFGTQTEKSGFEVAESDPVLSLPSRSQHSRVCLLGLVGGDKGVCDALIEYEKKRTPDAREYEITEAAIWRLRSDKMRRS